MSLNVICERTLTICFIVNIFKKINIKNETFTEREVGEGEGGKEKMSYENERGGCYWMTRALKYYFFLQINHRTVGSIVKMAFEE